MFMLTLKMMSKKPPYKTIKTDVIYKNNFLTLSSDNIKFDNGNEFEFTKVDMISGSSVLAINDMGETYLIEEYKHAISEYSLEVISGRIDVGETPLDAAKRELEEEAGLLANDWVDLGLVNPFTSVIKSPNHLFLAQDLKKTSKKLDDSEVLKVITLSFNDVVDMVMSGKITHAGSCVAILKADRYLENK